MQTKRYGGDAPIQIGSASLKGHVALQSSEFAQLKAHGKRLVGRYVVISLLPAQDEQTRLGIIVGRRYNTRAVKRNRARRLIRECFRLLQNGFTSPVWIALIARNHLHNCKLQDLQQDVVSLLREAGVFNLAGDA